jgi:hypothetical protein
MLDQRSIYCNAPGRKLSVSEARVRRCVRPPAFSVKFRRDQIDILW